MASNCLTGLDRLIVISSVLVDRIALCLLTLRDFSLRMLLHLRHVLYQSLSLVMSHIRWCISQGRFHFSSKLALYMVVLHVLVQSEEWTHSPRSVRILPRWHALASWQPDAASGSMWLSIGSGPFANAVSYTVLIAALIRWKKCFTGCRFSCMA